MRSATRTLFSLAAAVAVTLPATTAAQDFQWSGRIAEGQALTIRGINGSIRAIPSDTREATVEASKRATRGSVDDVRIEVVEHAGGVTICAVYPNTRGASRNECNASGSRGTVRDNDVQVEFVVRVQAGTRFEGHNVNGSVEAEGLRSDVTLATVNGRIRASTSGRIHRASTVNGGIEVAVPAGLGAELHASTVNGAIETDFPVQMRGRLGRRSVQGTIGAGGPEMRLSTVNGSIRLRAL
jgi:hypothetical protein